MLDLLWEGLVPDKVKGWACVGYVIILFIAIIGFGLTLPSSALALLARLKTKKKILKNAERKSTLMMKLLRDLDPRPRPLFCCR